MGPDLSLQRVNVDAQYGLIEDPERNPDADCTSRSPKDPQFVQREVRTISLASDDEFIFTCSGRY